MLAFSPDHSPLSQMLKEIDLYFDSNDEPVRSCLNALRHFILQYNPEVSEIWRYRMPFYCFSGKRFCYLWVDKKRNQPYIGFVDGKLIDHPELLVEKRSRMKIFLIDPTADLPVETIEGLLELGINLV